MMKRQRMFLLLSIATTYITFLLFFFEPCIRPIMSSALPIHFVSARLPSYALVVLLNRCDVISEREVGGVV